MAETEARLIGNFSSPWVGAYGLLLRDFQEDAHKGRSSPSRPCFAVGIARDAFLANTGGWVIAMQEKGFLCALGGLQKIRSEKPVFVEMMGNDFAIPMDATLDAIMEHYNTGGAIFKVPVTIYWE